MRIKTFLIMVLSLASLTAFAQGGGVKGCLLYTSPSPRD